MSESGIAELDLRYEEHLNAFTEGLEMGMRSMKRQSFSLELAVALVAWPDVLRLQSNEDSYAPTMQDLEQWAYRIHLESRRVNALPQRLRECSLFFSEQIYKSLSCSVASISIPVLLKFPLFVLRDVAKRTAGLRSPLGHVHKYVLSVIKMKTTARQAQEAVFVGFCGNSIDNVLLRYSVINRQK